MIPTFEIFKVDDYGQFHFVETADTLHAAKGRVGQLARLWPAKYVISSRITGETISIQPNVN